MASYRGALDRREEPGARGRKILVPVVLGGVDEVVDRPREASSVALGELLEERPAREHSGPGLRVAAAPFESYAQDGAAGSVGVDREAPDELRVPAVGAEAPDELVVELLAAPSPHRAVVQAERREAVGERAHGVDLGQHLAGLPGIDIDDLDERAGHVVAGHSPSSFQSSDEM